MNSEYKLIVSDLDRTLLKNDRTIPKTAIRAIQSCAGRNIRFAVATARPLRSVQEYLAILPCDAVIALNGAVIVHEKKVLYHPIAAESAASLIKKILEKNRVRLSAEIEDILYANFDLSNELISYIYYPDFPRLPSGRVLKILVELKESLILDEVNGLLGGDVYCSIANHRLIQIMNKRATKWNGIRYLLEQWGLSSESVVYFGDDYDDVEPIRKSGMGVAMANAIDPVKQAANFITGSNEEDGVADFLLRYILN